MWALVRACVWLFAVVAVSFAHPSSISVSTNEQPEAVEVLPTSAASLVWPQPALVVADGATVQIDAAR